MRRTTTTVRGSITDRSASKTHRKVAIAKATKTTTLDLLVEQMQLCADIALNEIAKLRQKTVNAGRGLMNLIWTAVRRFNEKYAHAVGATASYSKRKKAIRFYSLAA